MTFTCEGYGGRPGGLDYRVQWEMDGGCMFQLFYTADGTPGSQIFKNPPAGVVDFEKGYFPTKTSPSNLPKWRPILATIDEQWPDLKASADAKKAERARALEAKAQQRSNERFVQSLLMYDKALAFTVSAAIARGQTVSDITARFLRAMQEGGTI